MIAVEAPDLVRVDLDDPPLRPRIGSGRRGEQVGVETAHDRIAHDPDDLGAAGERSREIEAAPEREPVDDVQGTVPDAPASSSARTLAWRARARPASTR